MQCEPCGQAVLRLGAGCPCLGTPCTADPVVGVEEANISWLSACHVDSNEDGAWKDVGDVEDEVGQLGNAYVAESTNSDHGNGFVSVGLELYWWLHAKVLRGGHDKGV